MKTPRRSDLGGQIAYIASADAQGRPHLAVGRIEEWEGTRLVFSGWLCPQTLANIGANPSVSVTIPIGEAGWQFSGRVEHAQVDAVLDGWTPGEDPGTPQSRYRPAIQPERPLRQGVRQGFFKNSGTGGGGLAGRRRARTTKAAPAASTHQPTARERGHSRSAERHTWRLAQRSRKAPLSIRSTPMLATLSLPPSAMAISSAWSRTLVSGPEWPRAPSRTVTDYRHPRPLSWRTERDSLALAASRRAAVLQSTADHRGPSAPPVP